MFRSAICYMCGERDFKQNMEKESFGSWCHKRCLAKFTSKTFPKETEALVAKEQALVQNLERAISRLDYILTRERMKVDSVTTENDSSVVEDALEDTLVVAMGVIDRPVLKCPMCDTELLYFSRKELNGQEEKDYKENEKDLKENRREETRSSSEGKDGRENSC